MKLRISEKLALPIDVAGEAIAILAKRGAGKTNTATVLVEELVAAHVQVAIVDPVGAWWGLRHSADGKKPGLAIPVLGGQHGDVPLEPTAGALIADVVVDSGESILLDLSDFPSKGAIARFVTDFAERLYHRKGRSSSLLHLVLEEADSFAPQKGMADTARMRGAVEQLVRRGRSRGIGITMVTQRSAVLNKDVLSQADLLIAMRTTSPHDVAAIKTWIAAQADELQEEVVDSLGSLATGEAWIWNPERDLLERVKIRRRRTFDSSSTPKAGERRTEPERAAAIDLDALGEQIQATAEKARENDPGELRRQIRELQRRVDAADQATKLLENATTPEPVVERVEVPVSIREELDELGRLVSDARDLSTEISLAADRAAAALDRIIAANISAGRAETVERKRVSPAVQPSPPGRSVEAVASAPARRPSPPAPIDLEGVKFGKGERTVLEVLAEYPEGRTYNELAFLAGYSAKASTLGVILSNLRKAALVEVGNQPVRPTAAGLDVVGGARERPTGQALLDQWLRHPRMGEGERRVLLELIATDPDEPTHEELCERTGYSPTASTMGVILSKLRKLGLVQKGARRIAPEFMEAIG